MLDLEIMMRIVQDQYVPAAVSTFGDSGAQTLRNTLTVLRALYRHIEPELIDDTLIVVSRVTDKNGMTQPLGLSSQPQRFSTVEMLAASYPASAMTGNIVIEVRSGGQLDLYLGLLSVDPIVMSRSAIVYMYSDKEEHFFIGGQKKVIYNPSNRIHASVFAIPTFNSLEAALQDYKNKFVSTSQCLIFTEVWTNSTRLILRNKPEETMRRSLTQYLKTVLRPAEVRPEQIVDESHPVDIKVTWPFTMRLALIEIKWLGDAITQNGNLLPYRDARAREGAKQLADYLDANSTQAPNHETIGYLVVIDARRRGLKVDTQQLPSVDAFWYADKEIEFDPLYHTLRQDFAEPVRMFAKPSLSACRPD